MIKATMANDDQRRKRSIRGQSKASSFTLPHDEIHRVLEDNVFLSFVFYGGGFGLRGIRGFFGIPESIVQLRLRWCFEFGRFKDFSGFFNCAIKSRTDLYQFLAGWMGKVTHNNAVQVRIVRLNILSKSIQEYPPTLALLRCRAASILFPNEASLFGACIKFSSSSLWG
jgi:hypothetical protein